MSGKSLALLIQESANLIGDPSNTVFSASVLTEWINFAIDDLTQHFPRVITYTINCVDDQRVYDLETNFLAAISVEYPQGEEPRRYLYRRARTDPNFTISEGYYDILERQDASSANPPQLILSEKPSTGEDIELTYSAVHNHLSSPSDTVTLFDRHTHLIALFTRWKAYQELATTEGMDPDPVKLLSATVEVNAYRAERAYYDALRRAKLAETASARVEGWRVDKWDGSY
jgi:hypothetical protein